MTTRRAFAGVLAASSALFILGGCDSEKPNKTLRYQMVVEVETPQGTRRGVAVRALEFSAADSSLLGESRPHVELVGEAVSIDLPDGQTLFALLIGDDGDVDYAKRIADRSGLWGADSQWPIGKPMELWPTAPTTERLRHASSIPMLVTFKDIKNPISVKKVNPNDFAVSFGRGYRLKAINIQVTDEPVTTGIEKRLLWLSSFPEPSLSPGHSPTDYSLPATIKHGAFRRGGNK